MDPFPPPVARGIGALAEGTGRTIAIAGPPISGKSALLAAIRDELAKRKWRGFELRGTYRDRETPYAALSLFGTGQKPETITTEAASGTGDSGAGWPWVSVGGSSTPGVDERRRRRGGPPGRLGAATHRRGGRVVSGPEVYGELIKAAEQDPSRPVVLLIEDATLFDAESRDAILYLCERVRYRPILIVLALDVTLPAFGAWEERLRPRGDVEWVRFAHPKPDPREESRFRENFETLPENTKSVLVVAAVLGGTVGEVRLARATRLRLPDLATALAPAAAANMIRLAEGRITISHAAWVDIIPGLAPEPMRRQVHREIGEALLALHPEPTLDRGLELARHLFESSPDSVALRQLLQSAEAAERAGEFDTTEELLTKCLACLPSLLEADRPIAEAELRVFRARALAFSGRVEESEPELRDGLSIGLKGQPNPDWIEDLVEEVLPALRASGPRLSLTLLLDDLAERCAEARVPGAQILLQIVQAEFELERGRYDLALSEAGRAVGVARRLDPVIARSARMIVDAIAFSIEGPPPEAAQSRYRPPTGPAFGRTGRYGLQDIAEELELRLVGRYLEPQETLNTHLAAIPTFEKMRAPIRELGHVLDAAEIMLDGKGGPRAKEAVDNGRRIAMALHLIPPSPLQFRLQLLEGRSAASEGRLDEARDIWSAVASRPRPAMLPPYEAEARIRLALLELSDGHPAEARPVLERLDDPDIDGKFPHRWYRTIVDLALVADGSRSGSGPMPLRS